MSKTYSQRYTPYMTGETVPQVADITEGFSEFPAAIYLNRHLSEFAACWYGFPASSMPFHFREDIKILDTASLAHLEETHCDAFIEVESGAITAEYLSCGMRNDTTHCLHSSGKSWTSATWADILLPHADRAVTDFLPQLKQTPWAGCKIRHLMDMQVPVKWWEVYDDPDSPVVLSGSACGFDVRQGVNCGLMEFIPGLQKDPDLEIGDWHYVSANTLLLAKLGSLISKRHNYEVLADFYQKMGLEYRSGIVANFKAEVGADGGQCFTLRDQVKLPWAMANGGLVGKQQAISHAYIDDIFCDEAGYREAWKKGEFSEAFPYISYYRNQWYVINNDVAMGVGSYGQFIVFNRSKKIAIAKFSTYKHGQDFETALGDISWLIARVL